MTETLDRGLRRLRDDRLSHREAVALLEHAALLAKDDRLPMELDYESIGRLLCVVFGHPMDPDSSPHLLRIFRRGDGQLESVRLARGVDVFLTPTLKVAAVSVQPALLEEGRRAMSFVGIGLDSATDVAERHDDYLIDAYSHKKSHGER